ncbi:target of SBF [Purpureocillium takamizusanense]|uniref:Target of SBF n=1 Tax=Purpureocillium takamizusanense TaxID=2060973 RepID=A0A9Q8QDD5_9HYPO|nr:target of SBF [Purpureocillium takamizusanense]UNI16846.1 target of SBF [Purpureocillium takamizusanense]
MDSPPARLQDAAGEPSLPAASSSTMTGSGSAAASTLTSSSANASGTKRSAPALLPAFEPLSSSPGLPRPLKRQNTGSSGAHKYPTPVPTSSTGILSSSPLRRPTSFLRRKASGGVAIDSADASPSERAHHHYQHQHQHRAPLSAVPALELPENGEAVAMGRSSNSSQFQLSANRLVSRVHLTARYVAAANPLQANRLEILCTGWNGLKLHCQGRTWELFKGDSFTSETEGTDVLVDVLDARVMIQWPKRRAALADTAANLSDSSWDDSPPRSRHARANSLLLQSSPLRRTTRIASPESPTPAGPGGHLTSSQRLQALLPTGSRERAAAEEQASIEIYEDEPELPEPKGEAAIMVDAGASMRTEATNSFSSDLSDPEDDEHNPDEENDPIVHSFGPFGADISGRLASITTKSPKAPSLPGSPIKKRTVPPMKTFRAGEIPCSPTPMVKEETEDAVAAAEAAALPSVEELDPSITNHVINQLAFSRLSSTPLSTIMQNLPAEAKTDPSLTPNLLRTAIEATPCVGIIRRQGKDAAGKALESEYYYVPEHDGDEQRRAAVVDGLRKPSLRNCRKQHKQYYWKRPRTP